MASKKIFRIDEKFGVWMALESKCFWCEEPIDFKHSTIDHLIPEKLNKDPLALEDIKLDYGLDDNFQINDFCNWVPAHSKCNQKKSDLLFKKSPVFIEAFERVSKKAGEAKRISTDIKNNKSKSKTLAKILSDVESEKITLTEIEKWIEEYKYPSINLAENPKWNLNSDWSILREEDSYAIVSDGKRDGTVPGKGNFDLSWMCPNCGSYGPWNGVICLTCGMMSDPGD